MDLQLPRCSIFLTILDETTEGPGIDLPLQSRFNQYFTEYLMSKGGTLFSQRLNIFVFCLESAPYWFILLAGIRWVFINSTVMSVIVAGIFREMHFILLKYMIPATPTSVLS